jgi:heme a synthase
MKCFAGALTCVDGVPLNSAATAYNRAHHLFALFLAAVTYLLIVAGALVTSNNAGLSVPDWPTSFGSLYKMPPMVGGVKYEHGHRMVAEFVGLLCIIFAIWTWRVERRRWMRILGIVILGAVIAQGVLGGITVLKLLPWEISTAHATLAQTIFGTMVAIALATSRRWLESEPSRTIDTGSPSLRTLSTLGVIAVWIQLVLGAAFRHTGVRLLPHVICAGVVTLLLMWTTIRTLPLSARVPSLAAPAQLVLSLLVIQLILGFGAYVARVQWSADAPQPLAVMVITTVAHVATGALVLAASLLLAIQIRRELPASPRVSVDDRSPSRQAVNA